MSPEMELVYIELIEYVPEEYEKLLHQVLSKPSAYDLSMFLQTLGKSDKIAVKTFEKLIGHTQLDYVTDTTLAKEMIKSIK